MSDNVSFFHIFLNPEINIQIPQSSKTHFDRATEAINY